MKFILHQRSKHENFLPKRCVFQDAAASQVQNTPRPNPDVPPPNNTQKDDKKVEKKRAEKPAPSESLTLENMTLSQLKMLLEIETNQTQKMVEVLIEKLERDTTLLERFQKEAEQKKDLAETPEQKTIKLKKEILDFVENLIKEKGLAIPAIFVDIKRNIEREHARLIRPSSFLTPGNLAVIGGVLGFFAINCLFSGWKKAAVRTAVMSGLGVAVGLAAYAGKELPDPFGKWAQKVWSYYLKIPGVSQHFRDEALETQAPIKELKILEEVEKIQRLKTLLSHYRRGALTIETESEIKTFRTPDDLFQQILYLAESLKFSEDSEVQKLINELQNEKDDNNKKQKAGLLLEALNKLQLEKIYQGKAPKSVMKILLIRKTLLGSIRYDTDDVPRDPRGEIDQNFKNTLDGLKNDIIPKLQAAREQSQAYFRRMASHAVAVTELGKKVAEDAEKLNLYLQDQQTIEQTERTEIERTLQQYSGIVSNLEQVKKDYRKALSEGSRTEMFDTLIRELQKSYEKIIATRTTGNQGRYQEVERLCDLATILAVSQHSANQIPAKPNTNKSEWELMTQAIFNTVGIGGLALYGGAAMGIAVTAGKELVWKPMRTLLALASYGNESNVSQFEVRAIQNLGFCRAYLPNIVFGGLHLGLAYYHYLEARDEYQRVTNKFPVASNVWRALRANTAMLSAIASGSIGVNAALWRTVDIRHIRREGDAFCGRKLGWNIVIFLGLETAFTLIDEALVRTAISVEANNPDVFKNFSNDELVSLFAIYQENWPQALLNRVLRYFGSEFYFKKLVAENRRREMRGKILAELGKRLGGLDQKIVDDAMLPYYRKYAKDGRNYNYDEQTDREVLLYAIWYAQLTKAHQEKQIESFDEQLSNDHKDMTKKIDAERKKIDTLGLQYMIEEKTRRIDERTVRPELRYIMEGFKGDVREMLEFYQMYLLVRDNTLTTEKQKESLKDDLDYIKAFIEVSVGASINTLGAVTMKKQSYSFQEIQDFLDREKGKEKKPLLQYYGIEFLLEHLKPGQRLISSDFVKLRPDFLDFFQKQGVIKDVAAKFTEKFFEYEYWKGKTDLLIHRKKAGRHEVFLAGEWREALSQPNNDTEWDRKEKKNEYSYYERTVDNVTYVYLPLFNCFFTMPPTVLPDKRDDFYITMEDGKPKEPKCNINDMKLLTTAFIPQKVFDGLIENALKQ